ncbi:oxidoreductase-like protein [Mycena floridula]|nr:oxidoreductase-like protein [Mycena floridula]
MPRVLIIGATRGLGASLANYYAAQADTSVFGTTRSPTGPKSDKLSEKIVWVPNVDVSQEHVGRSLVNQLPPLGVKAFDVVIITAGYFVTEDFIDGLKWEEQLKMYTTSAISPPFIVHSLARANYLIQGSKVILVSSESGSISLRHQKEGGGNYGHHASKAALNMVGKLLSLDLQDKGIIISIVHPGFMRTEMTAGVGYDKYWDDGGAVHPDEAAKSLAEWVEKELDASKSGEYWAPRGPRDIGTAEVTIGKNLPTPLQLPW